MSGQNANAILIAADPYVFPLKGVAVLDNKSVTGSVRGGKVH
ncbi:MULTISPECIES: hypothetical protein [Arthrobacter]|nr:MULTISPECIES: hypothetical protein [Arthrobacter]